MREIEFRGKQQYGKWVEGYYVKTTYFQREEEKHFIIKPIDVREGGLNAYEYEVIPETVGQYTGLKDKKDTKIFEGDIVKVKNCETFIIKYQHNEFRFIPICNGYTWLQAHEYKESDFEVIGNIYDNKELLEVQK